jgi:hypothetical protein
MNKYKVYTMQGHYEVTAASEWGAKQIVWKMLYGRIRMEDMDVKYAGKAW